MGTQRTGLETTDRCGTILYLLTAEWLGDVIEFLAPDRQIVTVPVQNSRTVAAAIPEQRRRILLALWRELIAMLGLFVINLTNVLGALN